MSPSASKDQLRLHTNSIDQLIAGYVGALKQLQQDFDIAGEMDINVIARFRRYPTARNGIDERMITALEQALDRALDELERCASRRVKHSNRSCTTVCERSNRSYLFIEASAAGLADAYRLRLQKRIGELLNRGGRSLR